MADNRKPKPIDLTDPNAPPPPPPRSVPPTSALDVGRGCEADGPRGVEYE